MLMKSPKHSTTTAFFQKRILTLFSSIYLEKSADVNIVKNCLIRNWSVVSLRQHRVKIVYKIFSYCTFEFYHTETKLLEHIWPR